MQKQIYTVAIVCAVVITGALWVLQRVKTDTPLAVRDGAPVFRADDERPIFLTTRGCAQLKTGTLLVLVACPPTFSVSATYPEPKPWGAKW